MKAVLISIQPQWCELIASGKKMVEVRKTKPKLETPFKVYIYCTLSGSNDFFKENCNGDISQWNKSKMALKKGKVIGEFVCAKIETLCERVNKGTYRHAVLNMDAVAKYAQMKPNEIINYIGLKPAYGWHISDLEMYDKPKELREFTKPYGTIIKAFDSRFITRPPQSWCYVEELTT